MTDLLETHEGNEPSHEKKQAAEEYDDHPIDFTEEEKKSALDLFKHFTERPHKLYAFLIDQGISLRLKRYVLGQQNLNGSTLLDQAIRERVHYLLVKQMIETAGNDIFLRQQISQRRNALHQAATCGSHLKVFTALVKVAGKASLIRKDKYGNTPLHYACRWCESNEVIEYLAEEGGKELLLTTNKKGQVPYVNKNMRGSVTKVLFDVGGDDYKHRVGIQIQKISELSVHELIQSNEMDEAHRRLELSTQDIFVDGEEKSLRSALWFYGNVSPYFKKDLSMVIKHLIEVGCENLVTATDKSQSNALHYAVFHRAPLDIIKLLVETAGNHIVHWQNDWGNTPIHDACQRVASEEVLEFLLRREEGVAALQTLNNDKQTPLDVLFDADKICDAHIFLIQRIWYEYNPDFSLDSAMVLGENVIDKVLTWADSARDDSFLTCNNFVKAILNQIFAQRFYQVVVMMDLYVQVAIVMSLSFLQCDGLYAPVTSQTCESVDHLIVFLSISWFWLFGRELAQILSTKIENYVVGYSNYMQMVQIVLIFWIITSLLEVQGNLISSANEGSSYSNFGNIVICLTAISWLELLFIIGKLSFSVSVFTSAFVQIIVALIPFAFVTIILIAAFAQMFFIAGANESSECQEQDEEWQCRIGSSYFKSFSMLLTTDFEFLDWDPKINWQQTMVSIFFAIVVGILLLNILIGVVSSVFEQVREKSEDAFWKMRLTFLVEINTIHSNICGARKTNIDVDADVEVNALASSRNQTIDHRKSFAEYDDVWMRIKCPMGDVETFFKWWYYSWGAPCPSIGTRLVYFYKYAPVKEVVLSGEVFTNILFGLKYDERLKGRMQIILSVILSYAHFLTIIVVIVVVFVLGLCSFGLLWPTEMKEYLFFGPISSEGQPRDQPRDKGGVTLLAWRKLQKEVDDMKSQNADLKKQIKKMAMQNTEIIDLSKTPGQWS